MGLPYQFISGRRKGITMVVLKHLGTPTTAWRDRTGFCGVGVLDQPAGTLDAGQRAQLQALAARTKLVHDLVAAFADRYDPFPAELAPALTRELAALRLLLDRYGGTDAQAPFAPGQFADAGLRHDYERLVRLGSTGRRAALAVIAGLLRETIAALPDVAAPDVHNVCFQLHAATLRQLRVVQAWSGR